MRPKGVLLSALLVVAATLVAYVPALGGGFVWDDDFHVTENPTLRSWRGLARIWLDPSAVPQYYPLTHTSFWIEYRLFGPRPLPYHLTNVLLHAGSALLLGLLLGTLEVKGAWLAAAIFALHPVHVESVAWVTERKNTLSGLLALAAALVYLRRSGRDRSSYAISFLLFVGALLAKTVTATLPIALALVLWWKRGRLLRADLLRLGPMLAVGAAAGTLTAWLERHQVGAAGEEWSLTLIERGLVAGRALWFYLGKLVWPFELTFIYPRFTLGSVIDWLVLAGALLAGLALLVLRERIGRGPLVAMLYFAITLSPALGFFDVYPMRYSYVADHFQYLASIGPIALLAAACARIPFPVTARRLGTLSLLALLGSLTWSQGRIYRDQETLWRDTLAKNPGAWMAHNNLGSLLANRQDFEPAIRHFREAVRLKPGHAKAHDSLGVALLRAGRQEEALEPFREAVRITPGDAGMRTNLAEALAVGGRTEEGLAEFARALEIAPGDPEVHARLGSVLAQLGRHEEARIHLEEAIRIAPDDAGARYNLGTLYLRLGRNEEAVAQLEEALRLRPGHEKARRNLEVARRALPAL